MKFSPIHLLLPLFVSLIKADPPIPVLKEGLDARDPLDIDGITKRGLSGSSCDYGDPLGGSSTYSYTELCTTPSNCLSSLGGYVADNYCSGGDNNKCCVRSRCKSPYTGNYCADTRYYTCPGGSFVTGYCPGPSTYKCCV